MLAVAEMTPAERKHTNNGIWRCATHAWLVDRDESTYTIQELRRMKEEHEEVCAARVRSLELEVQVSST